SPHRRPGFFLHDAILRFVLACKQVAKAPPTSSGAHSNSLRTDPIPLRPLHIMGPGCLMRGCAQHPSVAGHSSLRADEPTGARCWLYVSAVGVEVLPSLMLFVLRGRGRPRSRRYREHVTPTSGA